MVAVMTGAGLGVERSSAFVLGSRGQLGSSAFGRYGENVYVNAATGNLAIERQDEMLIGVGLDDIVGRSYNSLGTMSDDNGDNWQLGASRRVTGLTGTVNTAGSTVTRYDWDGSDTVYTWDATRSAYVTQQGSGAYDTLTFAANVWTWTNGGTQAKETYSSGRLMTSKDSDGNKLSYTYTGSLLTRVTTQNGEHTDYTYTGNNLTKVVTTRADATTETRVRYTYDSSNRLSTVTTDLSPTDNSIADGKTVVTTYTYDGTSKRVASISQTGGASLAITYTLVGSDYRVATLAQTQASGVTATTTFSYDTTNRVTTVTDAQSNVTKLSYDTAGNLTKLEQPAATTGAATQVSNFTYTTNGDVASITDAAGDQTVFSYDANGNVTLSRDAAGNTVSYTYDSKNNRLTETHYLVPDPDGSGAGTAGTPVTTRYAYDVENHLRYVVSDEGRVTRTDYTAAGLASSVVDYATDLYTTSSLGPNDAITETVLNNWSISDKSGFHVTDTTYDARGNVSTVKTYTQTSTAGAGVTSAPYTQETYVYDQAGNLLSRHDSSGVTETFLYDGLNRLVGSTDLAGQSTSIAFTDSSNTSVVTAADGSTTTAVYDLAGELISTSLASIGVATETTTNAYDSLGNLRMVTDALNHKTYFLYDHAGRKVADITADGAVVETVYDAADRVAHTIQYATKPTSTQLASLVDSGGKPTNVNLSTLRPAANAADRWDWNVYDQSDRLVETISSMGSATVYVYDGASRLVMTTSYANVIASATVTGYKTTQPTSIQLPTADAAHDRVTRNFYSDDGLLVATLDADGALTQYVYDAAGEKTRTITSANLTSSGLWATGTLAQLVASAGTSASDEQTDYVYDDEGELRYTIEKNSSTAIGAGANTSRLTEFGYNAQGWLIHTLVYGGPIAAPASGAAYTLAYVQSQISALSLGSNPNNRTAFSIYDTAGRIAFSIDAMGGTIAYAYDAVGNIIKRTAYEAVFGTITDPNVGTMQSWAGVHAADAGNRITRTLYDAVSRPVYQVDAGGYVTETQYDALNRVTQTIRYADPYSVGDTTTTASLTATIGTPPTTAVVTTMTYDAAGRMTDLTDGVSADTHYVYDALDRVTDVTRAYGTADAATVHTNYDSAGRVVSVTGAYGTPDASVTAYTYDGLDRILRVTAASGSPDAVTTTNVYDALGNLVKVTDATGAITQYQYDSFGNVVKTTDPRGNIGYSYYDQLDRLVLQVDPLGYATATSYSLGGAVTAVTRYATATTGAAVGTLPTISTNATEDATTSFTLDNLDRVTKVTDALGNYEQYTLNAFGNRVWVRNKLGGITTNVFDARGLLTSETLPQNSVLANGTVQAASVTNTYAYDARGNRIQMVEASGLAEARTTIYAYDKMDRLVRTTHDAVYVTDGTTLVTAGPSAPMEGITYDLRGNVIEQVDAAGAYTLTYYDDADRKIAQISPLGTLSAWTYDDNGNTLTATTYGDLVTLPGTAGGKPPTAGGSPPAPVGASNYRRTVYTYDNDNRVKTTTITSPPEVTAIRTGFFNGSGYVTATADIVTSNLYDAAGNRVQATDANGNKTFFFYDQNGREVAEVDGANYLTCWTLDADGNVTSETRYATHLSDTVVAQGQTGASDWTVLQSHAIVGVLHANDRTTTFTYDLNGNRLTETRLGVVASTVSATGVLTTASTSATVTYTYNGLGEILSKQEATGDTTFYTYDSAGRQSTVTNAAFSDYTSTSTTPHSVARLTRNFYDGLGDLVRTQVNDAAASSSTDRVTTYAYGAGGRLASVTDASNFVTSYGYDMAGRTVKASYSRLKSDGTSVTEAQATQYDLEGRATLQGIATLSGSTWSFGDTSQTRYDAYGEVSAKGVNGLWQQSYVYDAAGRLASATQDDGTTQLYVHDANGNTTLTIASTGTDLSSQTVAGALDLLTGSGAHAVDAQNTPGLVVTISVFNKRNQQTATRLPYRELDPGDFQTVITSQTYDAFGDVLQTTGAHNSTIAGGVTDYAYNTEGKIVSSQAPTAKWTSENGAIASSRATQTNYYDISGRLVGVRDANGNLNTLALRAGTGYDGEAADTLKEFHADGGVLEKDYDVFGDVRTTINEVGQNDLYVYDAMDRLVQQNHQARLPGSTGNSGSTTVQLVDYYGYDGLGQRLSHWNSQLGASVKETTDYDAQGRVVSMVDMGGDTTTYGYAWSSAIATAGLGTFGGWTKTTVNAAGKTDTTKLDLFGRTVEDVDFGGHDYVDTFDKAGRLVTSALGTSSVGYSYYNGGQVAAILSDTFAYRGYTLAPPRPLYEEDKATSSYQYDVAGERTYEGYSVVSYFDGTLTGTHAYQSATVTWDADGRMTSFTDSGDGGTDNAAITWEYDLAGNIRHMAATYHALDDQGNVTSGTTGEDYWYRYDSMNRFVTTKGVFTGASGSGTISYGATGTDLTYDAAGERTSATMLKAGTVQREDYGYTTDGYLATAKIATGGGASVLRAAYARDAMGRVADYTEYAANGTTVEYERADVFNNRNQVVTDAVTSVTGTDTYVSSTTNYYTNGSGAYLGGAVASSSTTSKKNNVQTSTATTTDTYAWWDQAVQSMITIATDNVTGTDTNYYSGYTYDSLGHLSYVDINDGRPRHVTFVTSGDGTIIQRDENTAPVAPREIYYYFNGIRVGDVSNNGTSDTDYAKSLAEHVTLPGTGAFRDGAATDSPYADFDQSFDPINGLDYQATATRYTVQDGDTLSSIAQTVWGDASLWYVLADANGMDGSETLVAGQDLVVPNKVENLHNNSSTYRVYDPNDAIGNTSPTTPAAAKPSHHHGCGVFGQLIQIAIAVAVVAILHLPPVTSLSTAAEAAGAGALASVVSQGIGIATGIQDKFSFKAVALAGLSAGLPGLNVGPIGGSPFLGNVASGAITNALFQGVAVATGLQHSFDWAGVAAAGLANGVIGAVSDHLPGRALPELDDGYGNMILPAVGATPGNVFLSGMAGGIANAATRSLITGTDFGDNIMRALPSVIGNTIGNLVTEGIASIGAPRSDGTNEADADLVRYSDEERAEMVPTPIRTVDVPASQPYNVRDSAASFGSIDVKMYEGYPVTNIPATAFTDPRVGYLSGLEVKGNILTGNVLVDFNNVFNVPYDSSRIISALGLVNQRSGDGYGISLNIMPDTYINRILHPFSPTVNISLLPSDTPIDGDPDVGASYSRSWDSIRMHADAAPQWIEHEFAHDLGLNHSGFADSVMFPVSSATETQRTQFHIGEIKSLVNGYKNHK